MDLKALLLIQGVIVATCLSTFVGAPQLSPEPSASSPSALSSSSLCSRALATTLWGAAFAFFSLIPDAWPAAKAQCSVSGDASFRRTFFHFLLLAPVAPMFGILVILEKMFRTLKFRETLCPRVTNPELAPDTMSICNKSCSAIQYVLFILFGSSKYTRIVANTDIVLGISDSTKMPRTHIDTNYSPVKEDDIADALTLGCKTAENSCLMVLNDAGKLALWKSRRRILPNFNHVRFLDGQSGIATFIIAVQAIGYIISIVYRATHHLPVSPIEAIGFAYSMLVIVHSLSVGTISQSPLVIYLNPSQEQEMLDKCGSTPWANVDDAIRANAIILEMVVGSVVVAFTILVEWHVLKMSWLVAIGPILFLLSLITQLFLNIIFIKCSVSLAWSGLLMIVSVIISFSGIVVSIVATILNWQSDKFDSRTPSMIHNLPFLG